MKKNKDNRLDFLYCYQCKRATDSILLKSGQRTCRICGMGKNLTRRNYNLSLKVFIKWVIGVIFIIIGILWFLGWLINILSNWIIGL